MEIRLVKKEDLERLKTIWALCFGDEEQFVDFYFNSRNWENETAVLLDDGMIISMLTMIPADIVEENNERNKSSMLYAIATHPEFQKQGYADKLMEYSNQYLLSKKIPITMLVPAEKDLFGFYERRGYKTGFSIREAVMTYNEIEKLTDPVTFQCGINPAKPREYNKRRREFLKGYDYVDYRDEEISFQKKLCLLSGEDIYIIETEDAKGCAALERISEDEIIIKELLIPEKYLLSTVKQLANHTQCEKYIVRTPAAFGETLGGRRRPFGMLRINQAVDSNFNMNSYLGIAFD